MAIVAKVIDVADESCLISCYRNFHVETHPYNEFVIYN